MKKPEIEDIYPLSPMQRGMLFHALYEPGAGVYLQQVSCTLPAGLDVAAWQEAWNEVVKRHAALRTSLVWKRREQPLQVVLRRVELHWQELDWSRAAAAEQTLLEEAWRSADLQAGLPLERAPLMRFTLARLGGGGWRFLWSVHHLVVDGWSVALALGEAQETYAALRRGLLPPAAPAPSYGEYVHWLERLDPAAAEAFWRAELGGFAAPTPLGVERAAAGAAAAPGGAGWESAEAVLPAAASAALRELARGWRLTLSTVIQGAWAYLLGAYGGGDDVVFGLTVFGRPPELPDSDRIVGLFINTLPVRVRLRPAEPLRAWLEELQRRGARRGEFQHAPLSDLQGWSAVPRGRPLFESLLILDSAGKVGPGGGGEDGDL
ncbi:MAG TPA: condensation domain-containing protein, partial [Thermoanaerobaculia bacterium]|nr:condensation domain-containing protein [Thermoanaerobaculia bacterium]